jgi:hypothetical protein
MSHSILTCIGKTPLFTLTAFKQTNPHQTRHSLPLLAASGSMT